MKIRLLAATIALALTATTACDAAASYNQRMAYLRKIANRGVETHNLIVSQGITTTQKRCSDAYYGLQDANPPSDQDASGPSQAWINQVKEFFVDSCVTGYPKPVPGEPTRSAPAGASRTARPAPTVITTPVHTISPSPTQRG